MSTTVKIRRSGTASATPSSLEHGEIAINYADGKVFWKNASNVITSFTFQSYALASHTHTASAISDSTTAGRALLTAADAAAARTTLSVQPTASPAFTGTATFAGQVLVTAGSVSACSVAASGDPNTGLYYPAADTVGIVTGGSERVRVDANGNVGIGLNPLHVFHVGRSGTGIASRFTDNSTQTLDLGITASAGVYLDNPNSGYIDLRIGGTSRLKVGSTGTLTASQVYSDTVGATNRDLYIDDTGKLGYVSSIRASKTSIESLDDVSWLSALTPVSYRYRRRNDDGTYSDDADGVTDYGLIAEDVEAVRPELCFYDQVDGTQELRGVTYSKLITPMLRYIQQLEQRIAALEERLNHA